MSFESTPNEQENLEREKHEAERAVDGLKSVLDEQLRLALERGDIEHLKLIQQAVESGSSGLSKVLMTEEALKIRGLKQ